jgi:chromosome segregation ATPase
VVEVGKEFDQVMSADISPDQKMVVIGSPSKKVKVYDTSTGEELYTISKHTEWIMGTAFSPDGVLLASSDRNGNVMVWEASNGGEFYVLGQHKASSTDLAWRADSNILASSSRDGSVILWEMTEGKQVATWQAHESGTESLSFTPEGTLVTCGVTGSARYWDIKGNKIAELPKQPDVATQVVALHDGKTCAVGIFLREVKLFDLKTQRELGSLSSNPPLISQRMIEAEKRATELVASLPSLQEAAKKAQVTANGKDEALAKTRAELTEQDRRNKSYPAEIAACEKELAAAKTAITQATADKTARLAAIKIHGEKAAKLAAMQKEQTAAIIEVGKLTAFDKAVADANVALESAKKELVVKAGDAVLVAKVKELEAKLNSAKAEQQKLAPLKVKADQLTAAVEKAKAELGAAPAPVADLDKRIADNTAKVKVETDTMAAKKAELLKLPALVKAGPDRVKSAEEQLTKSRTELASAQFSIKSVSDEINILQKLPTALKAAQFNVGVLAEKANLAKLEGAFNDYSAAKKDNEEAKVSNASKIESSKKTIAVTTGSIPQHDAALAKLKAELNDLEQAAAPTKGADAKANTSLENHKKTLAARVAEVAALTKARDEGVAAAKKAADDIGKAIEPLKKKLAEVSARLKGPADQVTSKQANVTKLEAALAEAKQLVSALAPQVPIKEKVVAEADASMKKSVADIQAADIALVEAKKGKDAPAIAKAQSELDAKRTAKVAAEKSLNEAKPAANKIKSELAAANNTQAHSEKRLAQAKVELASVQKNAAPFQGQLESISKEIAAQEKARVDKQAAPAAIEAEFVTKSKPINDGIAQLTAAQPPLEKAFADARAKLEAELKLVEAKRIEVTKATETLENTKKQRTAAEAALAAAEKDNPQRDKNLAEISAELTKLQPQLDPLRAKVKQLETQYFTMLPK